MQATNGVDVLRYTESVQTTAAASSAQEVLRGLGYWFFYGDDPIGPWVGPSRPYQTSLWLLAVTFAVPVLALAGGARRPLAGALLLRAASPLVGLALAVGVYPYDDPSPVRRAPSRRSCTATSGWRCAACPGRRRCVVLGAQPSCWAPGVHALIRRLPRATVPPAGRGS